MKYRNGNILLIVAVFMPLMFGFLAFGVDAVQAIEKKASQESVLQVAQNLRTTPAITLQAKNAEDPGGLIAETVMSTLRNEGYGGAIEVWFYEAGASDGLDDPSRRLYAFEAVTTEDVPTSFARLFGIDFMKVRSSFVASSQPYAEFETWKPQQVRNGVFRLGEGQTVGRRSFSAASLNAMPQTLQAEIIGMLAEHK